MKIIRIRKCGNCPHNKIHNVDYSNPGDWVDYCILIDKHVNPNTIHEDCILEDLDG